jgi:hypothetical protein
MSNMVPLFLHALGWVIGASILGFAISAIFAGWLKLTRNRFLLVYIPLTGAFLCAFAVLNDLDVIAIVSRQWFLGVVWAALASVFLVRHVKSQPATRQNKGTRLAMEMSWAGLMYGLTDALFLNVMPVLAVGLWASSLTWSATLWGKFATDLIGLGASLLVALAYHLGYPEFRNPKVGTVLVGNSVITLAFLLSGNPLGSMISHAVMHIAAVWQGPETTIQLPPHYSPASQLKKEKP